MEWTVRRRPHVHEFLSRIEHRARGGTNRYERSLCTLTPSSTQPGSTGDYGISTPGNATFSGQEVKEDLPKPLDGRVMVERSAATRETPGS